MKWLRKLPVGRRRRFSFKSEQIISMNLFFFFELVGCCAAVAVAALLL